MSGSAAHDGPETGPERGAPEVGVVRDPARTLKGCRRVLIVGRTGSGKTTLARQLASVLAAPHVELDSLYFAEDLSTVPPEVLVERTTAAMAAECWVTDGNKQAVRHLVWPRADTLVWLDYPLCVSLWRLAKRARRRTKDLRVQVSESAGDQSLPRMLLAAARGVVLALRSHRGQRRQYPQLLTLPEHQHLAVVRLRSPRATERWFDRVSAAAPAPPGG